MSSRFTARPYDHAAGRSILSTSPRPAGAKDGPPLTARRNRLRLGRTWESIEVGLAVSRAKTIDNIGSGISEGSCGRNALGNPAAFRGCRRRNHGAQLSARGGDAVRKTTPAGLGRRVNTFGNCGLPRQAPKAVAAPYVISPMP